VKGPDVVEHTHELMGPELRAVLDQIATDIRGRNRLSAQSEPRVLGLFERFGTFVGRAFGVASLAEVSAEHVEAFVRVSTAGAREAPSVATMRLRRSALRLLFRTARELGLVAGDPTLDLTLPPRTDETPRPLIDEEVEGCRRASLHDLADTRLSVAWALGEATARTAEIPHVMVSDLDITGVRVWIHGSSNTEPRWGALTEWGALQLQRRVRALGKHVENETAIAHAGSGNPESRRSSSSQALRETLQRAGLTRDPRVRPASLAAWAGVRLMHQTSRIEVVARALGVRSLDAAVRIIDWDWATAHAEKPDG
jgi:site-specific recombinase XerC